MRLSDELPGVTGILLEGGYDCVDRIVLNRYVPLGHTGDGFRTLVAAVDRLGCDRHQPLAIDELGAAATKEDENALELNEALRGLENEFSGARYHVIDRGNLRHDIFATGGARRSFAGVMAEAVFGFCR